MNEYLSNKLRTLSFLLIIMVVFLHGYNANVPGISQQQASGSLFIFTRFFQLFFSDGVFRVAVPLFFTISGFLQVQAFRSGLNWSNYALLLKKRFFSLAIPYIIISAVYLILFAAFSKLSLTSSLFGKAYSLLPIDELFYKLIFIPVPFQLWFVRYLLEYVIIIPIIFAAIRMLGSFYLLLVFTTWFNFEFTSMVKATDLGMESFFFFNAGAFLGMHVQYVENSKLGFAKTIFIGIAWLVFIIFHLWYYQVPVLRDQFLVLSIVAGVLFVWYGYDHLHIRFNLSESLKKFTPYTFGIFIFHEPLLSLLKKILINSLQFTPLSYLITYLLAPVMAASMAFTFAYYFKRMLPGVYAVISGGR